MTEPTFDVPRGHLVTGERVTDMSLPGVTWRMPFAAPRGAPGRSLAVSTAIAAS